MTVYASPQLVKEWLRDKCYGSLASFLHEMYFSEGPTTVEKWVQQYDKPIEKAHPDIQESWAFVKSFVKGLAELKAKKVPEKGDPYWKTTRRRK